MIGDNRVSSSEITARPIADTALPRDLTRDYMIDKYEYLSSIGIWPGRNVIDTNSWLSNFLDEELEHALYLLNAFMYFSTTLVDQIFSASIRSIGRLMTEDQWRGFLDSLLITLVTGEVPNVTDSGYLYVRRAREFGIPQERIVSPEQACERIRSGFSGPVVFVDDLVGTGSQFIETWHRSDGTQDESFAALAPVTTAQFYYCPAFCTYFGVRQINCTCPNVTVSSGVFIPANYGALAPDSVIWPSHLKSTATDFLLSASQRAGIPDTGGTTPDDWRGFEALGLTIAFERSVPDATLPIIYWDRNGWRPLIRRTA